MLWSPITTGSDIAFADALEEATGIPVVVENDCSMIALALRWFFAGNAKGFQAHMPEIERLCAEELKARGGSASCAMITDPAAQEIRG